MMKSVGIDIGSSQIKVVAIQTGSKGLTLAHYHVHNFSQRANSDSVIETIEFLRNLASDYDPSQTRFCVCLRQDQVVMRSKLFPFNDRLKILKTLPLELDEDIPFSIDESSYDAKVVRLLGPQAEVLACAAPKVHLNKLLAVFRDGGIEPDIVSSEGIAFANLFEKWNDPLVPEAASLGLDLENLAGNAQREINVVLNIGYSRTLVCAFENNHLIAVRSLLWGGHNIGDAIAKKYELPPSEGMKEVELKGFILTTSQEGQFEAKIFSDTIAKSVRELLRDLQLSLLEFQSEFNAKVQRIDMTGGISNIKGLGPFMTQTLEVPVNRVDILDKFTQVQFERTDQTGSRLGVALGLAIEGLKKPRNPPLNFLRGEYAKQNTKVEAFIRQWSMVLKVAAASFIVLTTWAVVRESLALSLADSAHEAMKKMGESVANLKGAANSESGIRKYIVERKKVLAELKSLSQLAPMNSSLEILKKVNDRIPSGSTLKLDLKRFYVTDSNVLLEGYAGSTKEVDLLQQSLLGLAINGKVIKQKSGLSLKPGKTAFAIQMSVDRGISRR